MCFADTDLESGRSVVSTGVASGHLSLTSADSLLRRFSSRSCPDHTRIYNREKVGSYPESFYCLIILCSLTVKQIFSPITLIGDRAFSSILFRSRDINQHKGFSTPILLVKIPTLRPVFRRGLSSDRKRWRQKTGFEQFVR